MSENYFRVLALDGGGLKGLFTASFLAEVEDAIGGRVVDYVDLIVGTSTGGIIALGLGAGLSAEEIARFYESTGPGVFSRRSRVPLLSWFASKYDSKPLEKAITEIIGGKRLGESITRLVIPSANLDRGEVHLNKTSHHPRFERDYKKSMVEVALGTASAPTYFPPFRGSDVGQLVDGGIWANNPAGVAAVEAVGVLNWPADRIRMLSVGTTSEPLDAGATRRLSGGVLTWRRALNVILAVQSSASLGTAQHLVGHENIFRVDPIVPAGRYSMDGSKEFKALRALGVSEARRCLPRLRQSFFEQKASPFVPYHSVL